MPVTKIPYATKHIEPLVGCPLPLVSVGCANCWARQLHNQRHKAYLAGKKLPKMYAKPFEEIQFFPERLEEPFHWRKPQTIFVGSQTDLFHPEVPFEWIGKIFAYAISMFQHKFLFLTKRPNRIIEFFEWFNKKTSLILRTFPHLVFGVTICNQAEADEKIPILLQIPAAHRWLSIEPLLENIYLPGSLLNHGFGYAFNQKPERIDCVVVGCESGPKARLCKLEWINDIVRHCWLGGIKCFVKQVHLPKENRVMNTDECMERYGFRVSTDPHEWPEKLRVREFV